MARFGGQGPRFAWPLRMACAEIQGIFLGLRDPPESGGMAVGREKDTGRLGLTHQ
ncbi:hypothetical protein GALL_298110 [mine drainage metagenome]|uniref:Uncharacterized protein n=1 Tax=mine drainage metagenome TaxID=410659 RepID=A0A1J5QXL2_9ZZZZ